MKKNILILIAIITTLSVIGIVITQYVWVSRAIRLRTEQFDHSIQINLSNTVRQILYSQQEKGFQGAKPDTIAKEYDLIMQKNDSSVMMLTMIDSVLTNELSCYEPDKEYYYAIFDTSDNKVLYADPDADINELLAANHMVSLSMLSANKNLVLAVYFPMEKQLIVRRMSLWVLILSASFLFIVIACFLYIIFTIIHQKKISEMKNDFVNNMTHEFKTPISTISVASEMLMRPAVTDHPDKVQKYANIIYDENLRLRNQVEQVLQISILDKNELKIQPTEIDVHPIIENSVDIFNMIVRERDGEIVSELNAKHSVIFADELHFINVITNMLDNAIKYTDNKPRIKISTFEAENGITIRVEDNGIGIDTSDRKHIYKKFFRVHTGDVHNVKGFGLGLFYVKSVMDAHMGSITLIKSELSVGSVFELSFPFNFTKNQNI